MNKSTQRDKPDTRFLSKEDIVSFLRERSVPVDVVSVCVWTISFEVYESDTSCTHDTNAAIVSEITMESSAMRDMWRQWCSEISLLLKMRSTDVIYCGGLSATQQKSRRKKSLLNHVTIRNCSTLHWQLIISQFVMNNRRVQDDFSDDFLPLLLLLSAWNCWNCYTFGNARKPRNSFFVLWRNRSVTVNDVIFSCVLL